MTSKATRFDFVDYIYDQKTRVVSFNYRILFSNKNVLDFTETLELPRGSASLKAEELDLFLVPLFLVSGISYYKLYFPNKISLPFELNKDQAEFWNTLYLKGLGEFIFKNNLDPKDIAKFPFKKDFKINKTLRLNTKDVVMLGIGGGKDSIVAAELLRENNFKTTSFLLETQKADDVTDVVIRQIGNPVIKIKRNLDPKIFEQHEGSYNGHVPISAIIAFYGILSSALYENKYFAVGNGSSANIENITYKGLVINHQWSKTTEFEEMIQSYTKKYITPDIIYFSILRQFKEIRIVKLFSKYKKYFPTFTSCNKNFVISKERQDTLWCGKCPKCAFIFLMLSAFNSKEDVLNIFKKNLLDDEDNINLYKDLLGYGSMKPFDCVGSFEESQAALYLAREKFAEDIVVKTFIDKIKNPEHVLRSVMDTSVAKTLPTQFRFFGIENICIVGYGKEGKVTEQYLKKKYQKIKLDILDESTDKNYLDKIKDYDFAIKTPGVHKSKITIPYTTATNIFFSEIKNLTIGVTGTKGKSTTVSLIYDVLKAAGKKVHLVGNIGTPMLSSLLRKIDPDEMFVIELSSYQLDDIEYSPNVSVLTSLFPEHMDFHGSVAEYYKAKENIFRFQKEGDISIRPPYTTNVAPLKRSEVPLLGEHNLRNINAVIKVSKIFKVSDSKIKKAIKNFTPLPHRLDKVGEYKGITFYDDAISTTPESTIAAIETLKKVDTIFLGGQDRGYNFTNLVKILKKYKIKNIVLFPDSGKRILKSKKGFNVLETDNMYDAVEFAYENTKKGKICLLSTASPSYSIWKNFEEKGNEFKRLVFKLSGKKD